MPDSTDALPDTRRHHSTTTRVQSSADLTSRALETPTNNLPIQLNSFIGREREIAGVRHLLSESRLVTLTGAGGCGKTRLALQVASDVVNSFDEGVWWVELAARKRATLKAASSGTRSRKISAPAVLVGTSY